MANVQTPPQQLQPDGTVVTDPQQQAALQQQQQQGQVVQQQAANPAPQRTVSKTNTNKSSKNTNQTNQTVSTKERTLITKSTDLDLVNVRKDPNSKSAIVNELDDNEKVRVTGKNGDWYRVQDSKGNKGYIHKSQLGKHQEIYVTSSKDEYVNVRSKASSSSKILHQLPINNYVIRYPEKTEGDWYYIGYTFDSGAPDVFKGYIHKSQLKKFKK